MTHQFCKTFSDIHRIKNIHFVGIGGSGMSGIAEVLLKQGYTVTGSDINENNSVIARLRKLGAKIFPGHDARHIMGANLVVVSSAIADNNPEVIAAKRICLPTLRRAQMLAELMRLHHGIAVAGTHGKTTTTSLIASILEEGKLDPTFVIGGLLNSTGTHAHLGESKYFVAEADESDASFLYLYPTISVVTNIDADHMLTYDNDFKKLRRAFIDFLHRLPFYGVAVVCVDDPVVREILPEISRPLVTYGFSNDADIQVLDFEQSGSVCQFKVKHKNSQTILDFTLNLPGRHNVANALAAIAVGLECKVSIDAIRKSLAQFKGVDRRCKSYGELFMPHGRVLVVDDYGHHPAEIRVTVQALRDAWPNKRLVHVFQPHRYTRTQALFGDFAKVLSNVDVLFLLDIYPAGEKPIEGVSSFALSEMIKRYRTVKPILVDHIDKLYDAIHKVVRDGDLLLLQGAGSIGSIAPKLASEYKTSM
jgi:UDP-N-acetylmuramate--alanine ligase